MYMFCLHKRNTVTMLKEMGAIATKPFCLRKMFCFTSIDACFTSFTFTLLLNLEVNKAFYVTALIIKLVV